MNRALVLLIALLPGSAQVVPPGESGVSLGHLHFHSEYPGAHAKFWVQVFGAQPTKVGNLELYKLPGMFIAIDQAQPSGAMAGSTVPAIALKVRDLEATIVKAKAANARIADQGSTHALIFGPDEIRVELSADPALTVEASGDAIRFNLPDTTAARAWYEKTFGAIAGVKLEFSKSAEPPAATKGRVLDHIGFEVTDLKEFTRKLAASGQKVDLMYLKLPDSGVAIGFVTDPWGTFIELTEGLNRF